MAVLKIKINVKKEYSNSSVHEKCNEISAGLKR